MNTTTDTWLPNGGHEANCAYVGGISRDCTCPPAMPEATHLSICGTCNGTVGWIDCPTGGWWAHETHPADEHDAQPIPDERCPAGLLPLNADPVEPCVVYGRHDRHRAATGESWTDADSGLE